MKKILTFLMCILLVMTLFCACSKSDSDVNYIITFECENEKTGWKYEAEDEGIVTVTTQCTNDANGKVSYSFILESVGEGETDMKFSCFDTETNECLRCVTYLVKVNKDYVISAKLVSDETKSTSDKPVKIKNEADAERAVKDKFEKDNPDNEGKLFYETKKLSDGEYLVRIFRMAYDEEGNPVRRYVKSYEVFEDGHMNETKENFKDVPMSVK